MHCITQMIPFTIQIYGHIEYFLVGEKISSKNDWPKFCKRKDFHRNKLQSHQNNQLLSRRFLNLEVLKIVRSCILMGPYLVSLL